MGGCDTASLALPSEVSMNQQWSSKDNPALGKKDVGIQTHFLLVLRDKG